MLWIDFDTEELYVRGYDDNYMKIDTAVVDKKTALEIAEKMVRTGLEILETANQLKDK